MLEVTIFAGNGKELKRCELDPRRRFRIGRSTACEIQVPLEDVSRQHAELVLDEDGEWVLKDQDSTHGCVVGNERRRIIQIEAGTEVRIGSAIMQFTRLADRIGRELNQQLEDADPNAKTSEPLAETLPASYSADERRRDVVVRVAKPRQPESTIAGRLLKK